jgi:RNA polymerase sigma-70 factor, ECF subfamily
MSGASTEQDDSRDMERLVAGHDAALDSLMGRHRERLFHYLIRQIQNESEAADIAEETFVRVYQHRAKFDLKQKFTTWMYTIATNLVRDRLKWRARHPQRSLHETSGDSEREFGDSLPDSKPSPDADLLTSERGEAVRRAIAALPPELREPLVLATYEGLSQAEIGEILRCTPKAVETRIYRARQQLRHALADLVNA